MKGSIVFLLKFISLFTALLYLASCLTSYVSPSNFWPLTLLALGYPLLAVAVLVLAIGWLLVDNRVSLLLVLLLFIGYRNLFNVFAINFTANSRSEKPVLKVMTWNVRGFDNNARHAEDPNSTRRKMINFLKQENPDVLLLQEFVEFYNPLIYSNISTLRDSLGYKYVYMPADLVMHRSYGRVDFGCAILSKWPITDSGKMAYNNLALPENALTAVIHVNDKPIRVFTTHLASLNLYPHTPAPEDEELPRSDSAFINHASKLTKLRFYDNLHTSQATQLKQWISSFNQPSVLTGDFNLVPSAFAYNIVKHGMHDAFLEQGFGLGRTFTGLSPTLRIDYVLASQQVKVLSYYSPRVYLSDHFPVIVTLQLP